jgi:hypothetical protein
MKIKLEMDRERAILLMHACETIARVGMGQFKAIVELLRPDMSYNDGSDIEFYLKERIFPEMSRHSYNSMHNEKVNESTQVAWDAYQHIRREISWFDIGKDWRTDQRGWDEMMTVNYDEPFKVSKLKGDFKTERIEDDDEFYERVANEDL